MQKASLCALLVLCLLLLSSSTSFSGEGPAGVRTPLPNRLQMFAGSFSSRGGIVTDLALVQQLYIHITFLVSSSPANIGAPCEWLGRSAGMIFSVGTRSLLAVSAQDGCHHECLLHWYMGGAVRATLSRCDLLVAD